MQFLRFCGEAIRESFSFGWLVFGIVSTAMPALFALILRYWPSTANVSWIKWAAEHQSELHLTIAAIFFAIYLLYAPYQLYNREHAARIAAEQRLSEQRNLRAGIIRMGRGDNDKGLTLIDVALFVTNVGPPTIVDIAPATIKFGKNGERVLTVRDTIYGNDTVVRFQSGVATVKRSDLIVDKLATPIQTGDRVTGFLWYEIPGVSLDELEQYPFEITIPLSDAAGNKYEASVSTAAMPEKPGYLPGFNNPFLPFTEEDTSTPTPPPPTPGKKASPP
jgi:hypothetical protein